MDWIIKAFKIWLKSRQARKFIKAQIYISAHSPMYDAPKIQDVIKYLESWGFSKRDMESASVGPAPKMKPANHVIKD